MGINNNTLFSVNVADYKVCGFTANTRESYQVLNIIGNSAAEIIAYHFSHTDN